MRKVLTLFLLITFLFITGCSNSQGFNVEIGKTYLIKDKKLEVIYDKLPLNQDVVILVKSDKSFDPATLKVIISSKDSQIEDIYNNKFMSIDNNTCAMVTFKVTLPGSYNIKIIKNKADIIYDKTLNTN